MQDTTTNTYGPVCQPQQWGVALQRFGEAGA